MSKKIIQFQGSTQKMNHFDFTWKKYLSGRLSPEEEHSFIEYFENNPLNEIAVFESEKDRIGRRIRR